MDNRQKLLLNIFLSLALFAAILCLIGSGKIFATLAGANIWLVLLAIAFYCVVNLIMSIRIRIVLDRLGDRLSAFQILPSSLAGMLASDFTPARAGYFFTAFSLSSRFKIPLEKTMIAIFGPQLFDFLIKASSAAILFLFLVNRMDSGNLIFNLAILAIVFAGILGAGLFVFYPPFLGYFKFFEALPFVPAVFRFLRKMHLHADKVWSVRWPVLAMTFVSWTVKGLEWFVLSRALGISIFGSLWQDLLFMMVFQAAVTILQFLPIPTIAGAGASEAGFAVILAVFGISLETSIAFGFLTRLVMIIVDAFSLPVLVGYLHKHGLEKSLDKIIRLH